MLTTIISKLFPGVIQDVVKPYKEALDRKPAHTFNGTLDYANSLRKGEKPDHISTFDFSQQMAQLKGWESEAMSGITQYLKSIGFRFAERGPAKMMVNYELGVEAGVGGDPYSIANHRGVAVVYLQTGNPQEPSRHCILDLKDGEYPIDPVVKLLKDYQEQLKWFKSKRRR